MNHFYFHILSYYNNFYTNTPRLTSQKFRGKSFFYIQCAEKKTTLYAILKYFAAKIPDWIIFSDKFTHWIKEEFGKYIGHNTASNECMHMS